MNTSDEQMIPTSLPEKEITSDVDAFLDSLPDAEESKLNSSSPQCHSPGGTLIKRRNTTRPQRRTPSPVLNDTESDSPTTKKEEKKYLANSIISYLGVVLIC